MIKTYLFTDPHFEFGIQDRLGVGVALVALGLLMLSNQTIDDFSLPLNIHLNHKLAHTKFQLPYCSLSIVTCRCGCRYEIFRLKGIPDAMKSTSWYRLSWFWYECTLFASFIVRKHLPKNIWGDIYDTSSFRTKITI